LKLTGVITLRDNYSTVLRNIARQNNTFMRDVQRRSAAMQRQARIRFSAQMANPTGVYRAISAIQRRIAPLRRIAVNFIARNMNTLANLQTIGRTVFKPVVMLRDLATPVINKIRGAFNGLKNISMAIGGAVGVGIAGIGSAAYLLSKPLQIAGTMEQNKMAMSSLMKSGPAGDKIMEDLKKFSIQTPFEMPDLVKNTRFAMAMGFNRDDILSNDLNSGLMVDVGNAASGLGIGGDGIENIIRALGQMKAKTKVSAQEMNQLAENGIGAWKYVADAIGLTVAETMKLGEDGLLPAEKSIAAIRKGLQGDFGGMMAKQSKTLLGLWSTTKDFFNVSILYSFGEGIRKAILPNFEKFVKTIFMNEKAMNSLEGSLEKMGNKIGSFLKDKFEIAYKYFQDLSKKGLTLGGAISQMFSDALIALNNWVNSDNGQKLLGDIVASMVIFLDKITPVFIEVGVGIGKGILTGVGNGISEGIDAAIKNNKDGILNSGRRWVDKYLPGLTELMGMDQSMYNQAKPNSAGLSYAPMNNYTDKLHSGERVLTASQNKAGANGSGLVITIPKLADTINASSTGDVDNMLALLENRLISIAANM
jgi:tape measure domain-containing protein